ncbi:hypothetical protein FN846DRAFT_951300 [Sphaerosporella brunnea]|uniref:Uncharacterized protein n=1 Tax=Sphaerosporella brunnea TaxID=1250544 RepID=A0A5J5EW52_9PEZI|nr:hypothetical protein FN846DRAFT_951300 [Sphaerosporella brunnea]
MSLRFFWLRRLAWAWRWGGLGFMDECESWESTLACFPGGNSLERGVCLRKYCWTFWTIELVVNPEGIFNRFRTPRRTKQCH